MINYSKSSMVFSKNSPDNLKDELPVLLGLQGADQQERYLGLPSVVGRSKKGVFSYIRDRVWQRIKGWKCDGGLGFRSLEAFNVAMLAKQLWRLITKPQCLLSQALRAKYYPLTSIGSRSGSQTIANAAINSSILRVSLHPEADGLLDRALQLKSGETRGCLAQACSNR
ncbi:UNVERIFIED_CONTAM: hypothetical protein Sangu_2462500 [Sesamum angustifolium]|uniref:Reverse transcriptase n=1 Tax=Sesamum angustifolium TaxID=2727405 RepID=A0AAW2JUT9_9LAMI